MSLEKLMSDLTNFKYDISSPDKIDSQIEKGVDFFDDIQGGATGFTTQKENNLVSQYEKYSADHVGKKWPEAATSYEKERKGFDEYDVPETYKQILVFPSDTFSTPWLDSTGAMSANSGHPPQFDSPFMVTPIADYVSKYSQAHAASLTLTVPLVKSSMYSGAINVGDIPEQNFNKSFVGGAPYAHGYPFMVTPINTFTSRYPTDPSVTWGDEDGTMTGPASKWPNPSTTISIVNDLDRFSTNLYPMEFDTSAWEGFTSFESTWPNAASSYIKQRGVYNNYILGDQFSWIFTDINVPYGPSSEWGGSIGSIHISPDGQIEAGTRYGAMTDQTFTLYDQGAGLIDIESAFAPQKFANLLPVEGRTSQFADIDNLYTSPMGDETHISWNIPKINTSARAGTYGNADYTSVKNTGPFNLNASSDSDLLDQLDSDKYTSKIDDKIAFSTKGSNTFTNVPAGLDENNFQSTATFHDVSDPYGAWGFRQPFILRPIPTEGDGTPGNGRWGSDPINSDTGVLGALAAGADSFLGGFVRGAPTFTGLVERNFTDKIRIAKFILSPNGIGFIGKQFALQALNPTLESKIYNPLSVLGIPAGAISDPSGVIQGGGISGLATLLASLALPISHAERHVGGGRYEDVLNGPLGSRIWYQSKAFSIQVRDVNLPQSNTGFGLFDNYVNNAIESVEGGLTAAQYTLFFTQSNPNKYLFPISSAPKSVTKDGVSFTGFADLALTDVSKAITKPDATFNKKTDSGGLIAKYSTLAYGDLKESSGYGKKLYSPAELSATTLGAVHSADVKKQRQSGDRIVKAIGQQGLVGKEVFDKEAGLGLIKKDSTGEKYVTDLTDKINMHPYGSKDLATDNPDFIKFRFYDVVNNKYIIFRAILSGISDSITPSYGETQYLGRPDKLYTYKGADRKISFNFKIYPKTKQELPVLMEKLNYLIGLCYPTYTETNRMMTPFMELTMGDMFVDTPGLLLSLGITVEDTSTWEMDEGLQFPKYISCACSFQYIGKYPLHGKGKHYELGWLPAGTSTDKPFTNQNDLGYKDYPNRLKNDKIGTTRSMEPLFSELGQPETREAAPSGE